MWICFLPLHVGLLECCNKFVVCLADKAHRHTGGGERMNEMLCMCASAFVGVCMQVRDCVLLKADPRYNNNSFNKAQCVATSFLILPRWTLCSTELSVVLTVTCWMSNRNHCQATVYQQFKEHSSQQHAELGLKVFTTLFTNTGWTK